MVRRRYRTLMGGSNGKEFVLPEGAAWLGAMESHDLIKIPKVLVGAAAFFAVLDLADLFGGEFVFVGSFELSGHEGAEGFDFGGDGGEVELVDLFFDLFGVFVGDGDFAEVGSAGEPTGIDVSGVVFDEVPSLVGAAELSSESGAGEVAPGAVGGEGEEFFVVFTEDEEDGFGHVEGDEADEWAPLFVFPGGGGTFAVVEEVAAFPDEVVFVADGFDGGGADAVEEALVDALVVGFGPAGDVLEGFPVVLSLLG